MYSSFRGISQHLYKTRCNEKLCFMKKRKKNKYDFPLRLLWWEKRDPLAQCNLRSKRSNYKSAGRQEPSSILVQLGQLRVCDLCRLYRTNTHTYTHTHARSDVQK